jgi:glutathione synthase
MYPWESLNPKQDSTIRLVHECVLRDHDVSITCASNLTIRDSITQSYCRTILLDQKKTGNMVKFHRSVTFENKMVPLKDFDVIMMRDNPPLDPIVLNFLDSVKDEVFIVNAIDGLREANNKIYTAAFYDPGKEVIPATYVSKNVDYLIRVIEETDNERMIMKPLDGYGGRGVILIEKAAMANIRSLFDFYINKTKGESNYVILQDYVKGAENGDVRVLMLDGKPIGALRRRPAKDDVRSNISAGGSAERYKLTKEDKALCIKIGKKLVQDGIYFAGLDIIEGKLIEINVLSPGTITDINRLNNVKLQEKIVDYLEQVVSGIKNQKEVFTPELNYED